MSSQASRLGIPSFQLELEPDVRKNLATSKEMQQAWAKMIVEIYTNIIVPYW